MSFLRNLLFGKYLIITNTVSCGVMMGVGDVIQQRREQWKYRSFRSPEEIDNTINDKFTLTITQCTTSFMAEDESNKRLVTLANRLDSNENNHDVVRTRNMTAIGFMQGPFHHYFYLFLDRFLPGRSVISVIKKTFVDQIIGSPTCLAIFFFGHEMLEQGDPREINAGVMDKFIETYKVDCCFWPPAQLINFLFVPMQYRVIYINLMNVFYNVFLSYTKYCDDPIIEEI
ncbi:hypothetical protein PV325_001068 [Microctonus aethiopoides]|nr:hypothetical protein PV325_001068 [Microctonus aethiopoides]